MAASSLNKNNSAVKRIMQEARELANDPCTDYSAAPLEDDIFEWHCTLRGPTGTEFEGGLYHFRILLPAEYPFRPPSLMMLTPNGRFELNTKICISFTSYHEELWQPAWGVRTAIIGLQGFFPLKGQAAVGVGSIEYPSNERKRLAALSRDWVCPHCNQCNLELLPDPPSQDESALDVNTPTTADDSLIPAMSTRQDPSPIEIALTNTPPDDTSTDDDTPSESSTESLPANQNPDGSEAQHDTVTSTSSGSPAATIHPQSPSSHTRVPSVDGGHVIRESRRSLHKPPVLLDTAICVLLVMVIAIICRRVF